LVVVAISLLALLAAVGSANDFRVLWNPEGVRQYNASNPLEVEIGDRILFECPAAGQDYDFSNLWIQALRNPEQFTSCSCVTVMEDDCSPNVAINGQCIPDTPNPVLHIDRNGRKLSSFLNFEDGQVYYLTSYAPEETLAGALSEQSMGGQCLDGLRMVIYVKAIPTQPVTTAETDTEAFTDGTEVPATEGGSRSGGAVTHNTRRDPEMDEMSGRDPEMDEMSGREGGNPEMNITTVQEIPARRVRDWHIAAIVVVIVVLIMVIAVAGVSVGVLFYRYRWRGHSTVNPVAKTDDVKHQDLNEPFNDPIDNPKETSWCTA
jgi:hypothetical protein